MSRAGEQGIRLFLALNIIRTICKSVALILDQKNVHLKSYR